MNSASPIVRVASEKEQLGLSKAQKQFNKLIKQIDVERKRLKELQATLPLYEQKYVNEFDPLIRTFNELRAELVRLFDKVYAEKVFGKRDKAKIKDLICSIASQLIAENDDEDLKRIYNKHSGSDFDTQVEEEKDVMKVMMEDMLGIELGDDINFQSSEEMMAHVGEKVRQKLAEEEQAQQQRTEQRSNRKKSAKALAKEAAQQAETQNISRSIREVYRQLASALHPDKEPDALERDRKTGLMQRVNVAYDKKDLLQLLELQLEIEQIDQTTINSITEDRLKHYNKILMEQLKELKDELSGVGFSFGMRFNLPPGVLSFPMAIMRSLEIDIKEIERDIARIKNDLDFFQDIKNIKNFLKSC